MSKHFLTISLIIALMSSYYNQYRSNDSKQKLIDAQRDYIEVLYKSRKIYYWSGCMDQHEKNESQAEKCANLAMEKFKNE